MEYKFEDLIARYDRLIWKTIYATVDLSYRIRTDFLNDCHQEVRAKLLKAYKTRGLSENGEHGNSLDCLGPLIESTSRYVTIDQIRRSEHQKALGGEGSDFDITKALGKYDPEMDDRREHLEELLLKLPKHEREPIVMRRDGFKMREIAEELDIPNGTTRRLVSRLIGKLRKMSDA